jgi:hypothetical protein
MINFFVRPVLKKVISNLNNQLESSKAIVRLGSLVGSADTLDIEEKHHLNVKNVTITINTLLEKYFDENENFYLDNKVQLKKALE